MNISQVSTPIRKSQASARSVDPPYTPPLIRQIVGTARSSSRLTTISNADPAVCSCALAARSAIEPRSYPERRARPVPVSTITRIAESDSIRSNSLSSASRSSGCSRFKCFGRLRRMVARGPLISSSGVLAVAAASDMAFSIGLLVFQFAPSGFGVNGLGKIGMPGHQYAEVHEIEHQQLRDPRGGDIGRAPIVAEQRHFAEERAVAERHLVARQIDLDFAGGDEIHAVAGLALADDHGARRQVHGAQHMRHVGDRRGTERGKEWDFADQFPGLEEIVAAGLGGKAGGKDTGPEA